MTTWAPLTSGSCETLGLWSPPPQPATTKAVAALSTRGKSARTDKLRHFMATTVDHLDDPELLAAEWDLEPLVKGEGPPGVETLLEEATRLASEFQQQPTP